MVLIAVFSASALWVWAALQLLWPDALRLAIVVLGLLGLGLGLSLAQKLSAVLCWDGQVWHFSSASQAETEVFNPGTLTVSLDFGSWMLVCWQSHHKTNAARAARQWIPVQRCALQGDWHLWRCAVFGRCR